MKKFIFTLKIKLILFFLTILLFKINSSLLAQNIEYIPKRGGIGFRIDDNQDLEKYNDYAAIFNKYNLNFSFALNLGMNDITEEYIEMIREFQSDGHEMMDHTPNHRTNYFYSKFDVSRYIGNPGVYKVLNNKVYLNYESINTDIAKFNGNVSVDGNLIYSSEGIFKNFTKDDCYLYFPSISQLIFIDDTTGWIDDYTVMAMDFWRDSVNLGTIDNIEFFSFNYNSVHLTIDAIKALAEESLRLSEHYNITRPYSWIQPGGYFPHLYRSEVKQALSEDLEYKAAGIFANQSIKVFNEYNPELDKEFGMSWGDFRLYSNSFKKVKGIIADRIAKNHLEIASSHFNALFNDDWNAYIARVDSLLAWCTENNIPVKTYTEWADILYHNNPNPFQNIFPRLHIDLDNNGVPDGYEKFNNSILNTSDGFPNLSNYSLEISKTGVLAEIRDLGGIEKGENEFEIWTKGNIGNFIEVVFEVGNKELVYKFPAESETWNKFTLDQSLSSENSLYIPKHVSTIDIIIRCSDYNAGTVKISGMNLTKSLSESKLLLVEQDSVILESGYGNFTINVESNNYWSVNTEANWLNIQFEKGLGNKKLLIEYTANLDSLKRNALITISNGYNSHNIDISQNGIEYLDVYAEPDTIPAGRVEGSGKFPIGSMITLKAIPNNGWLFREWLEDSTVVSFDTLYTFKLENSRRLIARFEKISTSNNSNYKLPNDFQLYQNFPNPFNPSTIIKFDIPIPTYVTLKLYDVLGNEILDLVNENKKPGTYSYKLDMSKMSSGIYFYSVFAKDKNDKNYFKAQKMVFEK